MLFGSPWNSTSETVGHTPNPFPRRCCPSNERTTAPRPAIEPVLGARVGRGSLRRKAAVVSVHADRRVHQRDVQRHRRPPRSSKLDPLVDHRRRRSSKPPTASKAFSHASSLLLPRSPSHHPHPPPPPPPPPPRSLLFMARKGRVLAVLLLLLLGAAALALAQAGLGARPLLSLSPLRPINIARTARRSAQRSRRCSRRWRCS